MKKILAPLVAIVLILTTFLTGCSSEDREVQLKDAFNQTLSSLTETFSDNDTKFMMVEDYLQSWAKSNGFSSAAGKHYMVLSNPATKASKKADKLTLHVAVDTNNMRECTQPLAVALTALMGPTEHGNIKVIITDTNTDGYHGAAEIDKKYLDTDNLISINKGSSTYVKTSGSYGINANLSKKLSYTEPAYTNAYTIKLTIDNYKDAFDFSSKYPNPIDTVGGLLASCQSSGKLFQLGSFKCNVSDCFTPYSATAVIVTDDNSVESIQKKFDKSYESIKKKCDKLGANFVYTMTETSIPSKVLTHESSSSVISLMYTLDTGVYFQDEESGDIISANGIYNISTDKGKFKLNIHERAKTEEALNEMNSALETTTGLSDVNYKASSPYLIWGANDDLSSFFKTALSAKDTDDFSTILTSDLNVLAHKTKNLNCLQYTIADDGEESAMLNIVHFISHLAGNDENTPTTKKTTNN